MVYRKPTILIADDDAAMREILEMRLEEWGFDVFLAEDGAKAATMVESERPDMVLADLVMPKVSGLDLLRRLKLDNSNRPVILVTAEGSIDLAVEAMKEGAQDFITKPLNYPKLRTILQAACDEIGLRGSLDKLNAQLERGAGLEDLIGTSKQMRDVYELIRNLGSNDTTVIITGESGTGKELAARAIHKLSGRAHGAFVAVNASAIPENLIESEIFGHEKGSFTGAVGTRPGCFEMANRGTLLLDEIAEMPMALQPKLLRVLEERQVRRVGGTSEIPVDVRVIAATNQEPRTAVQNGRLREDLYYRLNVFTVAMPPLRERGADIPLLVQHFIRAFNRKHGTRVEGLREEAARLIQEYPWPGNVRELRNVIERSVILAKGEWVEPSHLPAYITRPESGPASKIVLAPGATLADAEKEILVRTLRDSGNNKAEAARRLGVDVKTIRNKLKTYGLDQS